MKVDAERLKRNLAKRKEFRKKCERDIAQYIADNYRKTSYSAYTAKHASQRY